MAKRRIAAVLLFLLAGIGWTREIKPAGARQAALAWMQREPRFRATPRRAAAEMRPLRDTAGTTTLAWLLQLEPAGFILLSPDDRLHPLLGFSFSAAFDTTAATENHLLLLIQQEMLLRLQALRQGAIPAEYRQQAVTAWQTLSAPAPNLQTLPSALSWAVEVGPLLSTQWGQDSDIYGNPVFNYYTPNNRPCGCVATAMSQMLCYHRWPLTGTGSHAYSWGSTTLAADFGAASYSWDEMVDNYYLPGDEPLSGRQAAGLLAWHAGIGVEMEYADGGSGALGRDIPGALQNYFRHSGAWVARSSTDFFARLYANMLLEQPAALSIGTAALQGHAVVIDGVRHESDGTRFYHINQGWNGHYDAWYDLSGPWSAGGYEWTTIEGAVMDAVPVADLDDPGETLYQAALSLAWKTGSRFNPAFYEIAQARLGAETTNFSDGAESGTGNWIIDGHWKRTSSVRRSGSWSFRGYIAEEAAAGLTFSTMELDRTLRIEAETSIRYYWAAYYFHNTTARLEISGDEKNWMPLRTHTSTATSISWSGVTILPAELAPWIGRTVALRFVIDYNGGSYYYGTQMGFYVDDFALQSLRLGSWISLDDAIPGSPAQITVTESGDYSWRVRASWNGQWQPWSDREEAAIELPGTATLQLRAFLEGPWSGGGTMRTSLRQQGILPLNSPYPEAPAAATTLPADAVDWILVGLREADGVTPAAAVSALLLSDGRIVDPSGTASLPVSGIFQSKNYYIVLRHRSHAAVMSAAAPAFSSGSVSWDFTLGIGQYCGSGGARELAAGLWGLWAGDADQDGAVNEDDFALWQGAARAGAAGYTAADLDLDGQVTTADYVVWFENERAGAASALP
ncbi:MAG TPA: C10 family peptidase [bacterium]|nr:C10 family peptidase [bacterium]HPG84637.1 C10 family peptidase [bacterium]